MPIGYYLTVTVHILAATLWLGGMLFLAVVGAPVLRQVEPPELRQRLFDGLGRRFRSVGWITVGVAIVTGIGNLYYRGWLHWDGVWNSATFWSTRTGTALAAKLLFVGLMLGVEAYHDFVVGPQAGQVKAGSPESFALRRKASWLARIAGLFGLGLLIAAVFLPRAG
jgi:uncharacterized membrane protein